METTPVIAPENPIQSPSTNTPLYVCAILASALGAFFGAQFAGPLLVALVGFSFGANEKSLSNALENNAYIRFMLILMIELLTVWFVQLLLKRRNKSFRDIGITRKPQFADVRRGLLTYGSYFLLYLIIITAVSATGLINTEQPQQLGFSNPHGLALVMVFLSLVVLPPIAEEILFRGYIYFGLRRRLSPYVAGAITSVLFSIAHLEFGSGVSLNYAAALDTFVLSCVLVYVTEQSKSLWPGMVVHATKNLVAFLALFVIK